MIANKDLFHDFERHEARARSFAVIQRLASWLCFRTRGGSALAADVETSTGRAGLTPLAPVHPDTTLPLPALKLGIEASKPMTHEQGARCEF